jgi:biotin transport system substrate-specific component
MLVLVLLILTPGEALTAVGGYLVLGAVGLPVFAGFKGGIGVLLGPTGGFLIGFFLAAALSALIRKLFEKTTHRLWTAITLDVAVILVMMLTYYFTGALWFAFSTGATVTSALLVCVVPFLLPDILKAIAACICVQPIRVALGRTTWHRTVADAS